MPVRAWIFILLVYLSAGMLVGVVGFGVGQTAGISGMFGGKVDWPLFVLLTSLYVLFTLVKVIFPNNQNYLAVNVFETAGIYLLPLQLLAPMVIVPHLVEWVYVRATKAPYLKGWFKQPFNISQRIISVYGAAVTHWVLQVVLYPFNLPAGLGEMLAFAGLILVYILLNHGLVKVAVALASGTRLRFAEAFALHDLLPDVVLCCMGYGFAVVWALQPFMVITVLAPIAIAYQALKVPVLARVAQRDGKTGLFNAKFFKEEFAIQYARAVRLGHPISYVMCDLDDLRKVNNTYGHPAGDVVIAEIGNLIQRSVRGSDVPGRFGGEEFAIILIDTDAVGAKAFAERLRVQVEKLAFDVATSKHPIRVTMSLGVATFPADAQSPQELADRADRAVYMAKSRGKNRVVTWSDTRSTTGRLTTDKLSAADLLDGSSEETAQAAYGRATGPLRPTSVPHLSLVASPNKDTKDVGTVPSTKAHSEAAVDYTMPVAASMGWPRPSARGVPSALYIGAHGHNRPPLHLP